MVEKLASSEIAQSRDAKEIKKFLRTVPINLADSDWKQVDRFIDAAVENAERDTRERCAQIAEGIAGTEPDGVFEAGYDCGARMAAERIRGKE